MIFRALILLIFAAAHVGADDVIIAAGTGGDEEYAATFAKWTALWEQAAAAGGARLTPANDLESLQQVIQAQARETPEPLWLVLLGHGTFDGKDAKFNLRGDDLPASALAEWLRPCKRPIVIVCGFSASGPFLKPLSAPDRIIVTATKSGGENNYSRFGGFFAEAVGDPAADLDKDGQTSVLEAWLSASQRVADFYKSEGRIATEHSLLEDNGDGTGTPPDWFSGVRVVRKAKDNRASDGERARQLHLIPSSAERSLSPQLRADRDALEAEVARLRAAKTTLPEAEYYGKLESILRHLAQLYQTAKQPGTAPGPAGRGGEEHAWGNICGVLKWKLHRAAQ